MLPFFLAQGAVAKRLCTGLQIRVGRFDSGPRLHHTLQTVPHCLPFLFATAPRTLATQKNHSTAPAQRIKLGAALSEFLAQHNCE
jgi:hypothetical protein